MHSGEISGLQDAQVVAAIRAKRERIRKRIACGHPIPRRIAPSRAEIVIRIVVALTVFTVCVRAVFR